MISRRFCLDEKFYSSIKMELKRVLKEMERVSEGVPVDGLMFYEM